MLYCRKCLSAKVCILSTLIGRTIGWSSLLLCMIYFITLLTSLQTESLTHPAYRDTYINFGFLYVLWSEQCAVVVVLRCCLRGDLVTYWYSATGMYHQLSRQDARRRESRKSSAQWLTSISFLTCQRKFHPFHWIWCAYIPSWTSYIRRSCPSLFQDFLMLII